MNRVRRRHARLTPSTRPACRASAPLTRLISVAEGMAMFKVGIDIGEIRREEATQFDKGFTAGFDAGYERGYDEAMRDVRELDDGYERGFDRGYLAALEDLGIGDRRD